MCKKRVNTEGTNKETDYRNTISKILAKHYFLNLLRRLTINRTIGFILKIHDTGIYLFGDSYETREIKMISRKF